jgi:hypothetical protein
MVSLFKVAKVLSDNHIRNMLDGPSPALLYPMCDACVRRLQTTVSGLKAFQRLGGRLLIALDGTVYHCSRKICCPQCSVRRRRDGVEYHHNMLSATIVAPGHKKVIPLQPEFIAPQDDAKSRTARPALPSDGSLPMPLATLS